ncbi:MAG: hypothetical protein ABTQ93_01665 [Candidatus Competibacter denitrificans]
MSFSLTGMQSSERFHFTNATWREVLRLGLACGWQPIGTVLNGRSDWKGGYGSNDYQTVTEPDALALADAIQQAVQSPLLEPNWADYLRQFIGFARQSGGFMLS